LTGEDLQQEQKGVETKGLLALHLFCNRIFFPGTPFNKTAEVLVLKIILIQLIHFSPNPLAFKTSIIVQCSILSKAFSKSSLKTRISSFDL
jgi:hypothetical protein